MVLLRPSVARVRAGQTGDERGFLFRIHGTPRIRILKVYYCTFS